MFPSTSKTLLINHIRHADTHNRIVEESEMWKSYNKLKEKGIDSRNSFLDDRREDMGMDFFHRSDRRAHMDDEPLPVTNVRGKDCTFWMRQLQKVEEADPDRWGHNGFKELYPNDFVSDQSDLEGRGKKHSRKKMKSKKKKKHKNRSKYSSDEDDKVRKKKKKKKLHSKEKDCNKIDQVQSSKHKNHKRRSYSSSESSDDSKNNHSYSRKKQKRKHHHKRSDDMHHRHINGKKSKSEKHSKKSRPRSISRSRSSVERNGKDSYEQKQIGKKRGKKLNYRSLSDSSTDSEDDEYINYKRKMRKISNAVSKGRYVKNGSDSYDDKHRKVRQRTTHSSSSESENDTHKLFTVSESEGERDSF